MNWKHHKVAVIQLKVPVYKLMDEAPIMHRKDLELHIEDLDIKRKADKNQQFILAMKESIREPIEDLSSASQSQIQLLTTQNQALEHLLEKKPSPNLLPFQPSSQPPPILTTSPSSSSLTLPADVGCNDFSHSDGIDLRLQKLTENKVEFHQLVK